MSIDARARGRTARGSTDTAVWSDAGRSDLLLKRLLACARAAVRSITKGDEVCTLRGRDELVEVTGPADGSACVLLNLPRTGRDDPLSNEGRSSTVDWRETIHRGLKVELRPWTEDGRGTALL